MIHCSSGPGTGPNTEQFGIAPECSIEEDDIRLFNCIAQFRADSTNGRGNESSCHRSFISELKGDAVTFDQINCSDRNVGVEREEVSAEGAPFDFAKRLQDQIDPTKAGFCFIGCVNAEWVFPLSHQHQAEGVIEVSVGEKDAGDRGIARWSTVWL